MSIASRKAARASAKELKDLKDRVKKLIADDAEYAKGAPMRALRDARTETRTETPGLLARARAAVLTHERGNLNSFPADLVAEMADALETAQHEREGALMDLSLALAWVADEDYLAWAHGAKTLAEVRTRFREMARA